MLLRLLRRRFPQLSSSTQDRLQAASGEQQDEWGERFADGLSLAEIFGPDQPHCPWLN